MIKQKMIDDLPVLVLEDERPLAEAISKKLVREGFSVVTARSVQQGLDYLTEIPGLSAIWLDHYLLGSEDGLDFVARVKQEGSSWKNVPIFVVSNTASSDKVQSYLHLGVNQYYTKSDHRLDEIVGELKKVILH